MLALETNPVSQLYIPLKDRYQTRQDLMDFDLDHWDRYQFQLYTDWLSGLAQIPEPPVYPKIKFAYTPRIVSKGAPFHPLLPFLDAAYNIATSFLTYERRAEKGKGPTDREKITHGLSRVLEIMRLSSQGQIDWQSCPNENIMSKHKSVQQRHLKAKRGEQEAHIAYVPFRHSLTVKWKQYSPNGTHTHKEDTASLNAELRFQCGFQCEKDDSPSAGNLVIKAGVTEQSWKESELNPDRMIADYTIPQRDLLPAVLDPFQHHVLIAEGDLFASEQIFAQFMDMLGLEKIRW